MPKYLLHKTGLRLMGLAVVLLCLCTAGLHAQTAITTINGGSVSSTSSTKTVTSPSDASGGISTSKNYTVTYGTGSLEPLTSFVVGANTFANLIDPDTVILQRKSASDQQLSIFYARTAYDNAPTPGTISIETTGVVAADSLYLLGALNAGLTNVLSNVDDVSSGFQTEIERIDYVWFQGIQTTSPTISAFPIFDIGGNDNVAIAAITAVDASGKPTAYGQIVGVGDNIWTGTAYSIGDITTFRQETSALDNIPTQNFDGQSIKGVAVTFGQLGIAANTNFYGYSLFAPDVVNGFVSGTTLGAGPHTPATGITLSDISTFPDDTKRSDAGLDLVISASAAGSDGEVIFKSVGPGGYKAALTTWLKANVGVTTATEGATVTLWEDQTINNYDFTTLGTAPTYRSTTNTINFNPSVDFLSGSERGLQLPDNTDYNTASTYINKSITMAFRTSATEITQKQQLFEEGGGTNGIGLYIRNGDLHLSVWNKGGGTGGDWNDNAAGVISVSSAVAVNTEYVVTLEFAGDASGSDNGSITAYLNGKLMGSITDPYGQGVGKLSSHGDDIGLGQHDGGSAYDDGFAEGNSFYGQISEFIYCNEPTSFTAAQRQKTNSYLAIKYGITLDQSTAYNYVDSDGAIIFNTTNAASIGGFLEYNKDIAGIGRDDASELIQLKSKSENANSILTIERASSIAKDATWLIWGNDGASTAETEALTMPSTISKRLTRVWRVEEKNDVGNTSVTFDLTTLGLSTSDASVYSLLIAGNSSNNVFTSATVKTGGVISGSEITFSDVNLTSGQYITLGTKFFFCSPGDYVDGIEMWLRADTGVITATEGANVTVWTDQTPSGNNGANLTAPVYRATTQLINDNPTVDFSTGSTGITITNAAVFNTAQSISKKFSILFKTGDDITTKQVIYEQGGATRGVNVYIQSGVLHLAAWNRSNSDGTGDDWNFTGNLATVNTSSITTDTEYLVTLDYNGNDAKTGTVTGYLNGTSFGTPLSGVGRLYPHTDAIGLGDENGSSLYGDGSSTGASSFDGYIAEMVYFNAPSSYLTADRNRIESAMAIKYGITLDQTSATNYTREDGTVIWNGTTNTAYKNDIAGIGRDDRSCLNQKQSQSVNTGSILKMGLGEIAATNAANANTFATDKSFLTWGNDNGSTAFANKTTAGTPGTVTERMLRVWKAQETGTVGNTDISFDLTGLTGYSTDASDYQLIIASGGDNPSLEAGSTTVGGTFNGTVLTFSDVNLTNGQFFTLGVERSTCGPAGIETNLQLWLRADVGTNSTVNDADITAWADQSINGNNASASNAPDYNVNNVNFNPSIDFTTGNSDYMQVADNTNLDPDQMTLFVVGTMNSGSGAYAPFLIKTPTYSWANGWGLARNNGGTEVYFTKDAYASSGATYARSTITYDDPYINVSYADATNYNNNLNLGTTDTRVKQALAQNGTDPIILGATPNGAGDGFQDYLEGTISEVIMFNAALNAADRLKVASYLAIKYGITLDQSSGQNYVNPSSTPIWTAANNSGFNQDIAGIGRDDASCFVQKQSKSVNADAILTIGLGTIAASNAANANSFADDGDYLIWGNDGGVTTFAGRETSESELPSTVAERMKRIWKVQDTGNVGATKLEFDLTGTGFSVADADSYSLLIGSSATMTGATITTGGSFSGNVLSFTGVDLTNAQFFTIGTANETCGPGGVNTDIAFWLAGDKETFSDAGSTAAVNLATLQQWNDQSSPASNASEIDLGGAGPVLPVYRTEEFNFNPVIRFADPNSTNGSYMRNTTEPPSGDFTLISVFKTGQSDGTTNDFVNSPALLGADDNGSTLDYGLGIQSGKVLINANTNTGTDAESATAYNDDNAHIASATRVQSSGAVALFVDSKADGTGTGSTSALTAPANIGVGNHSDPNINAQFSGDIAETIVFNKALNEVDRTKVESYLAIKYGITRVVTGLSEAAEDYLAGDGGIIWNIDTQGATYHNDIFGIGRDDLSCFSQQKSKSENSDALVTIDNNGSFGTNDSWLISGNDGAPIEEINNKERPATIQSRLNREWKVQETGTVGTIKLSYDLSTVTGPSGVGTNNLNLTRLMVDDDGDFTNGGTTLIEPSAIDGTNDIVTFDVDFTSGQYYSLGSTEVDALPITLIAFGSRVTGDNNVEISWATAQEVNNSFYTIERSQAGINFETIGFKEGAGNSNSIIDYTFIDKEPLQGTAYYRLKQTDFNGEFDYSEVTRVFVDLNKDVDYKVVPNPVSRGENFKVNYPVSEDQAVKLMISSANGGQQLTQTAIVTPEESQIEVGTAMLPKGLYIIRIVNKQLKQVTLKFIVN